MYKDSLDKQASWRFLMYVFLFLLPIFFAQMEVEACIHLKCAESVVQREIVPMIIIVFSNKGGTDKILSVIVDNACANQKVEVEFTVPLFSFVGFRIYVGSLVGNGGGEPLNSRKQTTAALLLNAQLRFRPSTLHSPQHVFFRKKRAAAVCAFK